jgi:large subunit ribosomal protein L25
MTVTLSAEKRPAGKNAKALRHRGMLPGIVYGPKQSPLPVVLSKKDFDKVFKTAGESTIIELAGLGQPLSVLVKEVDFAPTKGGIQHVDFYAVDMKQSITATIPLEFLGEAPAEKAGGVLNRVLHEIEVTCMPANLPAHIDVDLSGLVNIHDMIHVSDLVIPAGVAVETGAEEIVVIVGEPAEEEVAPVAEVDMSAIEVEKKGKTEEVAE